MTCRDIQPLLSDYLDRRGPSSAFVDVDAHLGTCDACQALLADLDRIRGTARTLGPIEPPDHIWLEIAGRIRLEQGPVTTPRVEPARPTSVLMRSETWQWLGLAAALLIVTTGVYVMARPDAPAPDTTTASSNATETITVETVEDTLRRAEAEYEKAITQLEAIVKKNDPGVSPDALATLQRNVTAIDTAIAESRKALTDNPASQPARTSLFEALASKVTLLQNTVVLMNEMRQGDADGAAEAAAGLGGRKGA